MIIFDNVSQFDEVNQRFQLANISFHVNEHETLWIQGANGSGKTTLLSLLGLRMLPDHGIITLFNTPITFQTRRKTLALLRQKIGYIAQENTLIGHYTLIENIALLRQIQNTPYDILKKEIFDLLQWFQLEKEAFVRADQLSSGEQQKARIAQAIIHRPKLVLADEPFTQQDDAQKKHIMGIFSQLRKIGTTFVIATRKRVSSSQQNESSLFLENGRIIDNGNHN